MRSSPAFSSSIPFIGPAVPPATTGVIGARVWLRWVATREATKSLSARALLVLLLLRDYQRSGEAFPSLRTLGEETQSSPDAVRRAIRELEAEGLVFREAWRDEHSGAQSSNTYRVIAGPPPCSPARPPLTPVPPKEEREREREDQQQKSAPRAAPAAASSASPKEEGETASAPPRERHDVLEATRARFGDEAAKDVEGVLASWPARKNPKATRAMLARLLERLSADDVRSPGALARDYLKRAIDGTLATSRPAGAPKSTRPPLDDERARQQAAARAEAERRADLERLSPPSLDELLAQARAKQAADRDKAEAERAARAAWLAS